MRFVRLALVLALAAALAACGDDDGMQPAADAAPTPDSPPPPDAPPAPDSPPPPPGTVCSTAIDLSTLTLPLQASTALSANTNGASCSGGAALSPELYYSLQVPTSSAAGTDLLVDVTVDEGVNAPYDVVVSARSDCPDVATELACSDVGWGEHLEVLDVAGQLVYLIVDGTPEFGGIPQGDFTLDLHSRDILGPGGACDPAGVTSRCGTDLICQPTGCEITDPTIACADAVDLTSDLADGSADVTGAVLPTDPDYYAGSCAYDVTANYPERIYRIDVATPSTLVADTDNVETTYDTVLYLRGGACDGAETTCNDDVSVPDNYRSRLPSTLLSPGTYYLFVDMSSGYLYGTPGLTPHIYRLTATLTPIAAPDAGLPDASPPDAF